MSSDDRSWFNDELRKVPLPDGFLAKLRDIGTLEDADIAAALRAVAMPAGWQTRWQGVVEDEALDQQLRAVPIPSELISNIFTAVEDERLQDVDVPTGVVPRARAVTAATRSSRWRQRVHMSLAASLAMLIVGSYVLAMAGLTHIAYVAEPETHLVISMPRSPLELTSMAPTEMTALLDDEFRFDRIEVNPTLVPQLAHLERESPPAPVDEINNLFKAQTSPTTNIFHLAQISEWFQEQEILGTPKDPEQPPLSRVDMLVARGFRPPVVPLYDRAFHFNHQTLPVVALHTKKESGVTGDQPLQSCVIPQWTDNRSIDRVELTLRAGKLPASQDVHPEDFLADVVGKLPDVAPGMVEVRTGAGPSPFGTHGAKLLLVTAQAGRVAQPSEIPRHLTIAINLSRYADQGAALLQVQAALRRLVDNMDSGDRLSLVNTNDPDFPLLQSEGVENKSTILQAISELSDRTHFGLTQSLQTAAVVADQVSTDNQATPTIVLLTNVAEQHAMAAETVELARSLKQQNVPVWIVPLGDHDSQFESLRDAGAEVRSAQSSLQLHQHLLEALRNREQIVAEAAMLTVRFDPRSVAAYRLIGHGSTPGGGWNSAAVETTLRSEQASGGLFEVWLRPGKENHVADVKLQYRSHASGKTLQHSQRISRRSFVPTFDEAAPALQIACIAAETAEVLRDSYFVESNRSLAWILDNAPYLNSQLKERPEFKRLHDLIRQAATQVRRSGGS